MRCLAPGRYQARIVVRAGNDGGGASHLGIPFIEMTADEWEAEKAALEAWPRS